MIRNWANMTNGTLILILLYGCEFWIANQDQWIAPSLQFCGDIPVDSIYPHTIEKLPRQNETLQVTFFHNQIPCRMRTWVSMPEGSPFLHSDSLDTEAVLFINWRIQHSQVHESPECSWIRAQEDHQVWAWNTTPQFLEPIQLQHILLERSLMGQLHARHSAPSAEYAWSQGLLSRSEWLNWSERKITVDSMDTWIAKQDSSARIDSTSLEGCPQNQGIMLLEPWSQDAHQNPKVDSLLPTMQDWLCAIGHFNDTLPLVQNYQLQLWKSHDLGAGSWEWLADTTADSQQFLIRVHLPDTTNALHRIQIEIAEVKRGMSVANSRWRRSIWKDKSPALCPVH